MRTVRERYRRPERNRQIAGLSRSADGRASPFGNRTRRALLEGDAPTARGAAHPHARALVARRRQLQRFLWAGGALRQAALAAVSRPNGEDFLRAYSTVSYERWSGRENRNKVWDFLGGRMRAFRGGDTCAARVSYALNNGGAPITERNDGWIYPNWAHVKWGRTKEPGDGKRYIVSAPYLQEYLTKKWGPPDTTLKTNEEARAYASSLASNEVAVFAGPHHAGIITESSPRDPYVFSDRGVMPVVVWKLPVRSGVVQLRAPV